MMGIGRSHFEGTIAEARWGAAETFWVTPCMHDNPKNPYNTAASLVAHLRAKEPAMLRQVYWNHEALAPVARKAFDGIEAWELQRQGPAEAEARRLLAAGRRGEAAAVLQRYIDENGARIDHEYAYLNALLPAKLKSSGMKYLFQPYLKEGTTGKGVPLP